jgi:hypothetical protein
MLDTCHSELKTYSAEIGLASAETEEATDIARR